MDSCSSGIETRDVEVLISDAPPPRIDHLEGDTDSC